MNTTSFEDLVGKPYKSGAQGPEQFDCWGLVVYIYKEALGVDLPGYPGFGPKEHPAKMKEEIFREDSDWQIIPEPEPFCCVAMTKTRTINHVGVWLDVFGGLCLHACSDSAVVAESMQRLKLSGFSKMIFLRYKGDPHG